MKTKEEIIAILRKYSETLMDGGSPWECVVEGDYDVVASEILGLKVPKREKSVDPWENGI